MFISQLLLLVVLLLSESNSQKNEDSGRIIYPGESTKRPEVNPLYHRYHYYHDHHHHHHNHDYNHSDLNFNKDGNEESLENESKVDETYQNETNNEIPVNFVSQLNGVSYTVNDLLLHYVDGYEDDDFFESRFGEEGEERANVQIPKPAQCIPELQTVSLRQSEDPTVMFLPSCTRIERCGGCCNHNKLECQPTEVENVNYQVIKTKFVGSSKLRFVEKIAVTLQRHTKCTCGCKLKAENCTLRQEYRENECSCVCRNTDEQKKCLKQPGKLWDSESCECQCRNSSLCSTGTTFDYQACKCILTSSMRRRYVDFPIINNPVLPLDEN